MHEIRLPCKISLLVSRYITLPYRIFPDQYAILRGLCITEVYGGLNEEIYVINPE
jgi:hypothetical protein